MYSAFESSVAGVPLTKPNLSFSICSMMANFYGISVGLATRLGDDGIGMDDEKRQDLYFRVLHVVRGYGPDIRGKLSFETFASLGSVGEIVDKVWAVLSA